MLVAEQFAASIFHLRVHIRSMHIFWDYGICKQTKRILTLALCFKCIFDNAFDAFLDYKHCALLCPFYILSSECMLNGMIWNTKLGLDALDFAFSFFGSSYHASRKQ